MAAVWFRRLAEVPGVGYTASLRVDRRSLPGHDTRPRETSGFLTWPTREGATSQSPAGGYCSNFREETNPNEILQRILEALELPGVPSDYHFTLMPGVERLWRYVRDNPELLEHIEALCLTDIRLVEEYPSIVEIETQGRKTFCLIPTFNLLIKLYRENGFYVEASDTARRARRFDNSAPEAEKVDAVVRSVTDENEP